MRVTMGGSRERTVKYLFIDGGYFREVVDDVSRRFFDGDPLPVDYGAVSRGFTKCFFYDCKPPKRKSETPEDYKRRCDSFQEHFDSLRMIDGWHVFEGVLTGDGVAARQKQVDIQIAVDMLSHAHGRNMDEITFIAGDQDFKPLVDALVREGMYIRLWYELRSASPALVRAADARRPMNVYTVHGFLTEDFRRERPLPHRVGEIGKGAQNGTLLQRGVGSAPDLELWRLPDGSSRITYADVRKRRALHALDAHER
jgi:uncharacterized LabA/DUF88 family protein